MLSIYLQENKKENKSMNIEYTWWSAILLFPVISQLFKKICAKRRITLYTTPFKIAILSILSI